MNTVTNRYPDDTTTPEPRILGLVATTAPHPSACGTRVRSPHLACQADTDPFRAGERWTGPNGETLIRCRCGRSWRVVAG